MLVLLLRFKGIGTYVLLTLTPLRLLFVVSPVVPLVQCVVVNLLVQIIFLPLPLLLLLLLLWELMLLFLVSLRIHREI
jgi:hypothetical protein